MARQLAQVEEAHAARMVDAARAHEIAERFAGWHVFSSRNGRTRLATRTGNQKNPGDDDLWAQSLICDDWAELEAALAVQAQHDAELTYEVPA